MDLSQYDNSEFYPGAGIIKRTLWYFVNAFIFNSWMFPYSGLKCFLLRLFNAKLGVGVVIKPRVNIKYPWNIEIGDNVWIGEGCWIDSLTNVIIGSNVCLSQDTYLLTGNHDYKDPGFSLITDRILIEDGVWVGAKCIVCPGSVMKKNSVLAVASVLSGTAEENSIYRGNPAQFIRNREMKA